MGEIENKDLPQKEPEQASKDDVANETDFSNSLIFIDTNVFLDFYRIRNSDVSIELLDQILEHRDSIIITSQIEMEFKKNRQIVFGQTYQDLLKTRNFSLTLPNILTIEDEVKDFNETKKKLNEYQKKLEVKFAGILTNPLEHDQVYRKLNGLFGHKSAFNLNRENIANAVIADLARKRFDLGYPPRKDSDNSIGDAINWEWIIECAKNSKRPVIIVTRDSDYGYIFNKEPYLNDWLSQEFRDRLNVSKSIFLTNKLTKAFGLINVNFSEETVEEEQNIISKNEEWETYQSLRDRESGWQAAELTGFSNPRSGSAADIMSSLQPFRGITYPSMLDEKNRAMMNILTKPSFVDLTNPMQAWNDKINSHLGFGSKKWGFKG